MEIGTHFCRRISLCCLLLCFLIFQAELSQAQNVVWANAIISGNNKLSVNAMCTSTANENITSGVFADTVDFDAGPGADLLNAGLVTADPSSIASFVCKASNAGIHLWAKALIPFSSNAACMVNDVTSDLAGNIYVVGRFQKTVDFDPGPGIDSLNSSGNSGAFIVKLDAIGNYIWGKTLIHNYIYLYAVKSDLNNDVVLSGNFESTVDFDPGVGVFNMTASTANQLFVTKLDTGGNFLWANTWAHSRPNASPITRGNLDMDNSNNIYVCGKINLSPIDLDPGLGIQNAIGTSFFVKLDQAGNYLWGHADSANSCFIKRSVYGDVYLCGSAIGLPNNIYLSKYTSSGIPIWTKILENPIVIGSYYLGTTSSITDDLLGNILIAGKFQNNYFLYQCDSAGNFLWVKKSNPTTNLDEFNARYNANNDLILSADFQNVLDVNFGAGVDNRGQSGSYGSFLMKYNYCGNNQTFNLSACDSIALPDTTLFVTANYVKEYQDISNCDSNVFIHAIVYSMPDTTIIACDSAVYNGQIYTQTGTYTQIVPPLAPGCDSIKTISVFINTPSGQLPFLNLIQTIQPVTYPSPPFAYVQSHNIEVDSLYNMYLSGEFNHSCDFNPLGTPYIDSSFYPLYNMPDGLVTKYDSSGMLIWMHKMQTIDPNGYEAALSISLNDTLDLHCVVRPFEGVHSFNFSNTYFGSSIIGNFNMPGWFGYVRLQKVLNDPTSNQIIKIGSIDSALNTTKQLYVKRGNNVAIFPSGGHFIGYEGEVDIQGNIYVAANMQVFQGGPTFCILAKLDSNLNMLWNKQIGKGDEFGFTPQGVRINAIKIDANGHLLICGRFRDSVDIDISPNLHILHSNGEMDAFVAKLDTAANLLWAHAFGGTDDDEANTITTDLNGKLYLGGRFTSSSIDLDPSAGVSFFVKGCANADWKGGYIVRYRPDGTFLKAMGSGSTITELQFKSPNRIYATGNPFVQIFEFENDKVLQDTVDICAGDSVVVGGSIYYQTGIYADTFFVAPGIDSIVITHLTVNALPTVIANASDSVLCEGDSVVLFGSGALTYVWNNLVIDSMIFAPNITNNYIVTGTDTNACVNTDSITVIVNALPIVVANASDTSVCIGNPVTLFGTGADSFSWTNSVIDSVAFYPIDTAMYVVTGLDNNGCMGQDSILIQANQIPFPILVFSGDTLYCTNVTGVNIYWYKDTVAIDSLVNYYVVTQNGNYEVFVVDSNGCAGADSISMLNVAYQTSIKSDWIQVYPNPTQGAIHIAFDLKQPGDIELMINDLLGKKVYSSSRKIPYSGNQSLSINLEAFHLKTGMYFLHIILDGKHHVLKVEYLR